MNLKKFVSNLNFGKVLTGGKRRTIKRKGSKKHRTAKRKSIRKNKKSYKKKKVGGG